MDELDYVTRNSTILALTFYFILSMLGFPSFGEIDKSNAISMPNTLAGQSDHIDAFKNDQNDFVSSSISITDPAYPPTIFSGNITLKGITNDSSGIKAISADAHTFPFNGTMPIKPSATPSLIPEGNVSKWSVSFNFTQPGVYRIVVTVRDNANNLNYAETTVNVPFSGTVSNNGEEKNPRISFVRPTFTEAAYQEHGFYDFYFKYGFPPLGKKITTDLDMLTVKMPRSIAEFLSENDLKHITGITSLAPINGTELKDVSYDDFPHPQKFWLPFIDQVKKVAPNSVLTVMRDEDVHDGHIFYPHNDNKKNAYDILLLFHNEYVTQQEYDNFKQFVKNGGTIVFIDANVFYAEVRYDRNNHTVTLVKGHSWQFDGKVASRSVPERWYDETKEWVGSNFLVNSIETNLIFTNNPFNYRHFEEQFVNNPKDEIIIDYGVKFPEDYIKIYSKKNELPVDKNIQDIVIAAYSLEYGKGEIISLGITARDLYENVRFMKFLENVVLPRALCPKFISCHLS